MADLITYPKRVESPQWECSDGRRFPDEEEAKEWERILPIRDLIYRSTDSMTEAESERLARTLLTHFAILPRKAP